MLDRLRRWLVYRLLTILPPRSRTEVLWALQAAARGRAIPRRELDWLISALTLGELRLRNAMVPRVDVVAVEESASLQEVAEKMLAHGRRRLVVYRESIDDPRGVVHALDVLGALVRGEEARAGDLARGCPTLPESLPLPEVIEVMRTQRSQLVMAVDERGGLAGIATQEDVLEQLTGPLPDEYSREDERLVRVVRPGVAIVRASTGIADVERALGIKMPHEDFVSLGGLVYERLGRVPREGDVLELPGVRIEVLAMEGARIRELRVEVPSLAGSRYPEPPQGDRRRLELRIGRDVVCGADTIGALSKVVVDPVAGKISQLVVRGRDDVERLVPIDLVEREEEGYIFLREECSSRKLSTYDPRAYVGVAGGWSSERTAYSQEEAVYSLEGVPQELGHRPTANHGTAFTGVEITRRTVVRCDGGTVGRVDLVLFDRSFGGATHVVVRRGLAGMLAPRDIIVPLSWATRITPEEIELGVSCDEVELLPEYRPDVEILGEVYQALREDPRFEGVDFYAVHVEVDEGIVRLRGHVRTRELRQAAEELAWRVRGVLGVDNGLFADEEITQEVAKAIEGDSRVTVRDLKVTSLLGAVELEGVVSSDAEREVVAEIARRVPGVQGVNNLLRVEPKA